MTPTVHDKVDPFDQAGPREPGKSLAVTPGPAYAEWEGPHRGPGADLPRRGLGSSDHRATEMTTTLSVLIVDDTEDIRHLVRLALERSGRFTVVANASDGAQAITQARTHQPDIVVLDVEMPVMDGLRALPLVRQASNGSTIVLFTALPLHQVESRGATTPDGLIHKGGSLKTLPAQLEHLHRKRLLGTGQSG